MSLKHCSVASKASFASSLEFTVSQFNPQPVKKYNIKIFESQIFFLIN